MARFEIDAAEFERLEAVLRKFPHNAEETINSVLHKDAVTLIQDEIKNLMPASGASWRGKAPAAKGSESLTDEAGNLSVTIKSAKAYHYLYFPDDGTSTRRHVGNQQFFLRGGESQQTEIIDRCISRLIGSLE